MKKLVLISIVAALTLASGVAFGQNASASHDVEIRIPNVLFLRITDGNGNSAATDPAVIFDFQDETHIGTYLDMVDGGGGDLEPTDVSNFGDVIVFSNRAEWSVSLETEGIDFSDNLGLGVSGHGVELSDITVVPSGTPGHGVAVADDWNLATIGAIAKGERTQGWSSLGFSGRDYLLGVNGDEDPGTYTIVVTYTIVAN